MKLDGIVSLLFSCIELMLLINMLLFANRRLENKLATMVVLLLMGYQFMEALICQFGVKTSIAAYIAFADISFLPPLMFVIILYFWNSGNKFMWFSFIPSFFFVVYYFFTINEFTVAQCTVTYATYNYPLGDLYGVFYYTPLLVSIIFLFNKRRTAIDKKKLHLNNVLLSAMLFISVPVILSFILRWSGLPELNRSIESIMCKSAIVLAFALFYFSLKNGETKKLKLFF